MILCPVCKVENHHLAVTCTSCGGYVQRRVDNLDLFNVMWRLFETPGKALHDVAISVHKNYVILLSAVAGVWHSTMLCRAIQAGEYAPFVLNILMAVYTAGLLVGVAVNLVFAGSTAAFIRLTGERAKFRNVLAICAYSQVPTTFMSIFLVPIEAMVWGIYFFTSTPEASALYPLPYYVVAGITLACLGYALFLYLLGLKKLLDRSWAKLVVIAAGALAVTVGLAALAVTIIRHL